MSHIDSFQGFYRDALQAKVSYQGALLQLQDAGKKCKEERDAITALARFEQPAIFESLQEAYVNGERVKDEMYKAEIWPKKHDPSLSRYSQILSSIPVEQRSPKHIECLKWWNQFEFLLGEIERLYPAPPHFWWNGGSLSGPTLYEDFQIAGQCDA